MSCRSTSSDKYNGDLNITASSNIHGKNHPPVANMLLRTGLNNVVLPTLFKLVSDEDDFFPCTKHTQQKVHNLFGVVKNSLVQCNCVAHVVHIVVNNIIV